MTTYDPELAAKIMRDAINGGRIACHRLAAWQNAVTTLGYGRSTVSKERYRFDAVDESGEITNITPAVHVMTGSDPRDEIVVWGINSGPDLIKAVAIDIGGADLASRVRFAD